MIFRDGGQGSFAYRKNNYNKNEKTAISESSLNNKQTELIEIFNQIQNSSGNFKIDISWNMKK